TLQSLHWLLHLRGLPTEQATTPKLRGKAAKTTRRGSRLRGAHSRSLSRKSIGLIPPIAAVTAHWFKNNVSFCEIKATPDFFLRFPVFRYTRRKLTSPLTSHAT